MKMLINNKAMISITIHYLAWVNFLHHNKTRINQDKTNNVIMCMLYHTINETNLS